MKGTHATKIILCILLSAITGFLFAQPANDDPCGAIELTVESDAVCVPSTPLFWSDATATPGFANPTCASYSTGDVWFKFVLTTPSDIFITTGAGNGGAGITDGGMLLYNNNTACDGNYFAYICDDDAGNGSMPQISLQALGAGTYYIRFWDYHDRTTANIAGICVSADPVVINALFDEPCTAQVLEIVNGESCEPVLPVSWDGASGSGGVEFPDCGSYRTGDIWFTFTLTDTSDIYISTKEGIAPNAIVDGALALYRADDCQGTLTQIICQNNQGDDKMPKIAEYAQLPGNYFVRFWDVADSTHGNIGGICLAASESVFIPILNDDPCGAKELPVIADTTCTPDNAQYWQNATGSDIPGDAYCGDYESGDVWFKFTLAETSDIIIRTAKGAGAGAITDGAMALYTAGDCEGPWIFAFCNDDGPVGSMPEIKEKTIPAGVYYIRFWDYEHKLTGNIGGICVAAIPSSSAAINDNCFTAIPFPTLSVDGVCASVTVNTEGASGEHVDLCGGIADDDVWYSFIVPDGATQVNFSITENGNAVPQIIRLNRGVCDDQKFLGCFAAAEGIFTDLVSGQLYTIRTHTIEDNVVGHYEICLTVPIPPVNDNPCGAITLISEIGVQDCVALGPLAWENATATPLLEDPDCGSYSNGDVWFKFELTQASDLNIRTFEGSGPDAITDAAFAIYKETADCTTLEFIDCVDDVDATHLMPVYSDFNVPPGFYYIRFWEYYDALSGNIGGICITSQPTISTAGNDLCENATAFPVILTDGSCASVEVNNSGATGSSHDPVPGFNDDDLWYKFVVPDGVDRLVYEIKTISGNSQHAICIKQECETNTGAECRQDEYGVLKGLFSGQTYFLRAYTPEKAVPSVYSICLRTPPVPPSNDECAGAIPFPELPADGSCVTMSVNTTWATSSGNFACGDGEDDLWYSFVMPDGQSDVIIKIITSGRFNDEQYEILTGPCEDLHSVFCLEDYDFESSSVHKLVPGQTYYVRAFTDDSHLFKWDMCLHLPAAPPVNDECPDAIAFPSLPLDGSCATIIADVRGATGDNSEACTYIYDDDIWYTFSIPAGYSGVIVNSNALTEYVYAGIGIYSGICDNLIQVGCHTGGETYVTGLTSGETYFARVHSGAPNVEGLFEICLRLIPPPPANDSCANAIAFQDIPLNGSWVGISGTSTGATGADDYGCSGNANDDVWYSFVVPDGVNLIAYRHIFDPRLSIALYEGDCDNLFMLNCYGASNSNGAFSSLTGGETYYLRIFDAEDNEFTDFELEISAPLPIQNDECPAATPFPPIPLDGSCSTLHSNSAFATSSNIDFCNAGPSPVDLWYSFVVPEDHTTVSLTLDYQSGYGLHFQLLEGSCDELISKECIYFTGAVDDLSGLTPGATYYLLAIPYGSLSTDFTLCLSVPLSVPDNDECDHATSVTSSPGVFADPGLQTTEGATDSDLDMCYPANQYPTQTYDVWYSFMTDQDGGDATVTVELVDQYIEYSFFNLHLQGLEGECGDFITLACAEDGFDENSNEDTIITIRMPGLEALTTYYFRLFPSAFTGNYAPVDFTVFAEGTALDPSTAVVEPYVEVNSVQPEISKVFPSPATNEVYVEFTEAQAETTTLWITDLFGHTIYRRTQYAKEGHNKFAVQVDQYPPGLYVATLEQHGIRSAGKRFIIQ